MRPATDPQGLRVDEPNLATTRFLRPARNKNNNTTTRFEPSRPLGSIGEYDLVQQLGRCVFVGHHRLTRQPFAIRVLEPAPGGRRDRVERQLAAAHALAAIDHPNVVRTIEVGLYEGRVYLVMEYLRGKALESALELHGALPVSQAIRIGMHVARGLEAAHVRGVVHRNLDAETVILVPSERGRSTVKLADFEIEPGDDVVRIARHSMSPELCRGGAIDHRTDLYSLGVLLHRVCTLKYPFEGTPIEILAMYRFRSVVRPPPALAGVPAELASTIQRCLSEDPADRPASAGEVLESLRRVADGRKRRDRSRPEAAERARPTPAAEPSVTSGSLDPVLLELEQLPTDEWAAGARGRRVPAPAAPIAAAAAPVPARFAAEAAPTLLEKPASRPVARAAAGPAVLAQTMLAAPAAPAAAKTVVAASPAVLAKTVVAGSPAALAQTMLAAPVPAGPPAAAPAVLVAPAPAIALKVPVPAAMPAAASPRSAPPQQAAPEPIDPLADSSGVVIAPSGPAHVAIALPLDGAAAAMPAPRRAMQPFRVPWKPVAVLVAAITAGSVLS
ncbi:MAG TPA: serine/threonine-protein kinase, partial [Kofleriaceae bacterium]|nr:serine/threonine-protein kinase [Kofleriaceae bacterium]